MALKVRVIKDDVARVLKQLKKLTDRQVLVGIPSSTAGRDPDPDNPEPINNAALGYIHENGSPARNIPARPWLKPGVAKASDEIARRYRTGAQAVLDGRVKDADAVHRVVGQETADRVKQYVRDQEGDWPPLKQATLDARLARGHKGTSILIETGQMINAVTFVVRDKKGKDA